MPEVPVSCSLGAVDLAERQRRWQALADRALLDVAQVADGLLIRFRRQPPVLTELHELAALERDCCGFARWTVGVTDQAAELRITGDGADALAEIGRMFSRLASSPGSPA